MIITLFNSGSNTDIVKSRLHTSKKSLTSETASRPSFVANSFLTLVLEKFAFFLKKKINK